MRKTVSWEREAVLARQKPSVLKGKARGPEGRESDQKKKQNSLNRYRKRGEKRRKRAKP